MGSPISVVIVDDHEVVRRGLVDLIAMESDLEVVGSAGNAAEAVELVRRLTPNVGLVDVRLADQSGIELCRDIRQESPSTNVLMFTSFADPDALQSAFAAGASGFLLKRMDLSAVTDAVRRVAAGETVLDGEAEALLADGVSAADPRLAALSTQERRVLDLIAVGKTNRAIAADMGLAEKTVKNYVSSVLRKLTVTRRAEAAAIRAGLGD